jgi:transposase
MARFRCRACGEEGTFVYDGRHNCPQCGSVDVQLAIGVLELPAEHSLFEAMERLAEQDGEQDETDE